MIFAKNYHSVDVHNSMTVARTSFYTLWHILYRIIYHMLKSHVRLGVSDHQHVDCVLNSLLKPRVGTTPKHHTLCARNRAVARRFWYKVNIKNKIEQSLYLALFTKMLKPFNESLVVLISKYTLMVVWFHNIINIITDIDLTYGGCGSLEINDLHCMVCEVTDRK